MPTQIGTGVILVTFDPSQVSAGLTSLHSTVTSKLGTIGKVGGGLLAGGVAAAVGGAAGLYKVGKTFDDLRDTIIQGTGASGKALRQMEKDAIAVGKTTPSSFKDIGVAITELHRRTGAIGKPLQETAKQLLNLSRITGTDLKTNVAAMTRLFGDWSIPTNKQSEALDKLYRASQVTGIGVDKLAQLMVQFGSPLRNLGLSFDFTTAMFSRFEKEGVNIQTAMPGLRMALKNFAEAGREPAPALMETFNAIKNAGSAAEANTIAFETFGARAGADLAAAVREGRFELGPLMKELRNSEGAIASADKRTRDFAESWQIIKNNVLIPLQPLAERVFSFVADVTAKIAQNLPAAIEKITSFVQQVKGAFSGGSGGFGDIASSVATAFHAIQAAILPIITDIVAAVKQHWPQIKETIGSTLSAAKDVIVAVTGLIRTIWDRWGDDIIRRVEIIFGGLAVFVKGALTAVKGVIEVVTGLISGDWGKVWQGLKHVFSGVWDALSAIVNTALRLILDVIKATWGLVVQTTKDRWNNVKDFIGNVWDTIKTKVSNAVDAVRDKLANVWDSIKDKVGNIWDAIRDKIDAIWDSIKDKVGNKVDAVRDKLANVWDSIKDKVGNVWDNIKEKIGNVWDSIKEKIDNKIDSVKEKLANSWDAIRDKAGNIWEAVKDKIDKVLGNIKDGVDTAVTKIGNAWDGLKKAAAKPVNFVIEWVWNKGIVKLVNGIPGVGSPLHTMEPIQFARGGPVIGGTPGKDSVRALLMPGEHILTTDEVKALGGQRGAYALRAAIKRGIFKKAGDFGFPKAKVSTVEDALHSQWVPFAIGGAALERAKQWAIAQAGKPYIWGGVGPRGFDCSGYMSGITNVLRGGDGYGTRYGTTATFPWPGFVAGFGQFTIGNSRSYGHMGGTLDGMGVESTNGSVRVGRAARGANNPMFDVHGHLGSSEWKGSDSSADLLPAWVINLADNIKDFFGKIGGWMSTLSSMGDWGKWIKSVIPGALSSLKDWLLDKVPDLGDIIDSVKSLIGAAAHAGMFDTGGILRSGQIGINRSGRPERVLDPRTTETFERFTQLLISGPTVRAQEALAAAAEKDRPEQSAATERLEELVETMREMHDTIKRLPRDYRMGERKGL